MNITWEDLELFLAVAEGRSFSAAARQLALTQPTISRRVAALEDKLEHALFRRDVEGAHLTDEGAKLLPAALQMARFAQEAEEIAKDFDDKPVGIVRVAVPSNTAFDFMVPFACSLRETLPQIQLQVISGIEQIDLLRGQADLALLDKEPTQPDLMVLAKVSIEMGVFASASYAHCLKKRASDEQISFQPEELTWISWGYPAEHLEPTPTLKKLISGFSPVFSSNDYNVQTRAMAEGMGAMVRPRVSPHHLSYDKFVQLEVDLTMAPLTVFLVCAKTMSWVPRVRAVTKELLAALEEVEGISLSVES